MRDENVLQISELFVKSLSSIVVFAVCCSSSVQAQKIYTVRDNVFAVLEVLGLQETIDVVEVHKNYILAKPRMRNGSIDNSLWNHIQTMRREKKPQWFHDNTWMSRMMGHGAYSYRQRGRPSLQAVFFFDKQSTLTPTSTSAPRLIKLDVDRFPPSSKGCITSARHFLQEQLPGLLFGKSTDQQRMAGAIQRRYKNVKAHPDARQVQGSLPIE